jgi:hypothetical protein
MKLTTNFVSIIVSIIVGGAIGFVGGSAWVLILWAIVGLAIGAFAASKKAAMVNGAVYGFVLSYIFMIASYSGKASLSTKLLPFLLFGIFGATCGLVLALVGAVIAMRKRARP